MDNYTYVSMEKEEFVGSYILYAGNDQEVAFLKIKEKIEKYGYNLDSYFVDVWVNGEIIKTYYYVKETGQFISE